MRLGDSIMLTKIEIPEVITVVEMKKKYPDKYIIYNRKNDVSEDNQGTVLVTALYVADHKAELLQISPTERFLPGNGLELGSNLEKGIQIGAVVYG